MVAEDGTHYESLATAAASLRRALAAKSEPVEPFRWGNRRRSLLRGSTDVPLTVFSACAISPGESLWDRLGAASKRPWGPFPRSRGYYSVVENGKRAANLAALVTLREGIADG
jgi:hypothetical protein